jgi:hypothetical protein
MNMQDIKHTGEKPIQRWLDFTVCVGEHSHVAHTQKKQQLYVLRPNKLYFDTSHFLHL